MWRKKAPGNLLCIGEWAREHTQGYPPSTSDRSFWGEYVYTGLKGWG